MVALWMTDAHEANLSLHEHTTGGQSSPCPQSSSTQRRPRCHLSARDGPCHWRQPMHSPEAQRATLQRPAPTALLHPAGCISRAGHELSLSSLCRATWRWRSTRHKTPPPPLLPPPAAARGPSPHHWTLTRTRLRIKSAPSATTPLPTKPLSVGTGTSSVFCTSCGGPASELCAPSTSGGTHTTPTAT